MLTLDLVPGDRLGPFALGLAVGDVLELVAENAADYSRVEVKLGEDHNVDILCSFPAHGFSLRFDSHSQTLRLVEVHDPSRLQLRYKGEVIGGSMPVTLSRVSALFGPTFPGEVCGDDMLALHYRGLVFLFAQTTAAPDVSAARVVLCAPAAHAGTHMRLDAVLAAAPPVTSPPVSPLVAVMGFGLRLPGGAELPFGCSLQDLVAELGPPSSSMVKASDAMLIHASAQTPGPSGEPYFLTWQHRGLDALIDGEVRRTARACIEMRHSDCCATARRIAASSSCCIQTHHATHPLARTRKLCSCSRRRAAHASGLMRIGRHVVHAHLRICAALTSALSCRRFRLPWGPMSGQRSTQAGQGAETPATEALRILLLSARRSSTRTTVQCSKSCAVAGWRA